MWWTQGACAGIAGLGAAEATGLPIWDTSCLQNQGRHAFRCPNAFLKGAIATLAAVMPHAFTLSMLQASQLLTMPLVTPWLTISM